MKKNNAPFLIDFPSNGSIDIGYIAIAENLTGMNFEFKRAFWAYYTPDSVVRGRHAHHETEMILIAVAGRIVVTTEMNDSKPEVFILEKPNQGLYLPKMCWHTMQYSHNAVQLVLATTLYDEKDYIRDYQTFLSYGKS
jgi:dTDP-4-dehydrorhamnose 3,5-epimerase-like enzyme